MVEIFLHKSHLLEIPISLIFNKRKPILVYSIITTLWQKDLVQSDLCHGIVQFSEDRGAVTTNCDEARVKTYTMLLVRHVHSVNDNGMGSKPK